MTTPMPLTLAELATILRILRECRDSLRYKIDIQKASPAGVEARLLTEHLHVDNAIRKLWQQTNQEY